MLRAFPYRVSHSATLASVDRTARAANVCTSSSARPSSRLQRVAFQASRQQVVSKSRQSSVRTYAILKELEEFFSGKKTSKVQEQREMGNRLSAAGASRQGWAPSQEGP